jgi:hypothetical protein
MEKSDKKGGTEMTGRETATIETLTASVKVLMLGSRQITLTIYRQLDIVDVADMDPFGRVNPKGSGPDVVHVVGRRKVTGELVKSVAPATWGAILQHTGQAENARTVAEDQARKADPMYEKDQAYSRARRIAEDSHLDEWHDQYIAELADRIKDITTPYVAIAEQLNALPLIVLAGLA